MARRPTLNDVVAASGLSIFTVSRALNNADGVSDESRRKVLDAARKVGYVPNRVAQALRSSAPGPVMVLTASTSNYYYIDMLDGIQSGLRAAGLSVRVVDLAPAGHFDQHTEDDTVADAMSLRSTGVISTLTLSPTNYERLTELGIPCVFVDSCPPQTALGTASITTDNIDATRQVGEHLAFHGYTHWLVMLYPHLWSTREARERGLRDVAARHGASVTILECDNDAESARAALDAHLGGTPPAPGTVLVCGNNPLLQGAVSLIRDRGLSVPDQLPVIAFDEFAWAAHLDPPLTVVDEDSRSIGERAAEVLTRILVRRDPSSTTTPPSYEDMDTEEVTASLIVRRSCGCP